MFLHFSTFTRVTNMLYIFILQHAVLIDFVGISSRFLTDFDNIRQDFASCLKNMLTLVDVIISRIS